VCERNEIKHNAASNSGAQRFGAQCRCTADTIGKSVTHHTEHTHDTNHNQQSYTANLISKKIHIPTETRLKKTVSTENRFVASIEYFFFSARDKNGYRKALETRAIDNFTEQTSGNKQ
jgi:hypothetical protein